jgi:DNA-binding XRE family transcriptional regulator
MESNEILEKIILHCNTNYNKLAGDLGLKRSQNLYDIRDGKTKISGKLALKIAQVYPQFNISWLLTGEGEMVKKQINQSNVNVDNISGDTVNVKMIGVHPRTVQNWESGGVIPNSKHEILRNFQRINGVKQSIIVGNNINGSNINGSNIQVGEKNNILIGGSEETNIKQSGRGNAASIYRNANNAVQQREEIVRLEMENAHLKIEVQRLNTLLQAQENLLQSKDKIIAILERQADLCGCK